MEVFLSIQLGYVSNCFVSKSSQVESEIAVPVFSEKKLVGGNKENNWKSIQ
jgi:hypothetical protein